MFVDFTRSANEILVGQNTKHSLVFLKGFVVLWLLVPGDTSGDVMFVHNSISPKLYSALLQTKVRFREFESLGSALTEVVNREQNGWMSHKPFLPQLHHLSPNAR